MTLRHPERLGADPLDDDDSDFGEDDLDNEEDDEAPLANTVLMNATNVLPPPPLVLPALATGLALSNAVVPLPPPPPPPNGIPHLNSTAAAGPAPRHVTRTRIKHLRNGVAAASSDTVRELPPPHPVDTDFGPQSFAKYIRAQLDKLRSEKEAANRKGKGRQRATDICTPVPLCDGAHDLQHEQFSRALSLEQDQDQDQVLEDMEPQPQLAESAPVSATLSLEDELEQFRKQWQRELKPERREELPEAPQEPEPDPELSLSAPQLVKQPTIQAQSPSRRSSRLFGLFRTSAEPRSSSIVPTWQDIRRQFTPTSTSASASSNSSHPLHPATVASPSTAFTSRPDARASRSANFEAFTRVQRHAVRSIANEGAARSSRNVPRSPRQARGHVAVSDPSFSGSLDVNVTTEDLDGDMEDDLDTDLLLAGENADANRLEALTARLRSSRTRVQLSASPGACLRPSVVPLASASEVPEIWERTESGDGYVFNYSKLVPENIPPADKKALPQRVAKVKREKSGEPLEEGLENIPAHSRRHVRRALARRKAESIVVREVKQYSRVWGPLQSSIPIADPFLDALLTDGGSDSMPEAIWRLDDNLWGAVAAFLSTQDVKNLRLVSRSLAETLSTLQFRNVVVDFDAKLLTSANRRSNTIFDRYGSNINKFGIAFEADLNGLTTAQAKVVQERKKEWFGDYDWPVDNYPRFSKLQAIEDVVDHNSPLLKIALSKINKACELGLCIDNGHGWLEGPDISDLALFDRRSKGGSKIFGKTFKTEDAWTTFTRNEYFKWSQVNTINETMKSILAKSTPSDADLKELRFLEALKTRDLESFRCQADQHDYDPGCHTGGVSNAATAAAVAAAMPHAQHLNAMALDALIQHHLGQQPRTGNKRTPQYPLVFNGYNVAAEHGGHLPNVQSKIANPVAARLQPGILTETQAQWLMETAWAQRAFLSAYTTAIITNKSNFQLVHTLRISKLSSGLLSSLAQREFWGSLKGLKKLEVFLSPDWRQEHIHGDKAFAQNMVVSPAKAAEAFTDFLRRYIAKLEHLHSLTIGYVGGGEHASGMYARNQHVLPAPIVDNPTDWLLENIAKKTNASITKFDHVRDLKFENCWFTPWMLEVFMVRSRDTSLHSLTLDSVSMTTINDATIDKPLTTIKDNLRCQHSAKEWMREDIPVGAAWTRTLNAITPGKPLDEYKYDAGLIDSDISPKPERTFRGHIERIILNSCGYVKVSLPKSVSSSYKQDSLVIHTDSAMDTGLRARKDRFSGGYLTDATVTRLERATNTTISGEIAPHPRVMISTDGHPWLGTLTQCVHPVEKRVLEQAWGMRFGWENDLGRWAAVEDGMFEGGTGRFSGIVDKEDFAGREDASA
jgi:hypothetical protein